MISSAELTWFWLGILTKERFDALLQVYATLEEALEQLNPEVLKALGCRKDTIEKTIARLQEFDVMQAAAILKKAAVEVVTINQPQYPERLKEIGDPPVFLSYKGDVSLLRQPTIGLVGTREMSAYGKRVTELYVPAFVQAHMVTVSGLALGIDAQVAQETMRAGGKTVAVLGNGLGSIYPKQHERLAQKILASGGLLLSEFPFEMQPDKFTFPARNRIIAGLCMGTVVLEAPLGSGAVITAELALDYGRDVFAVPGQIFDENYQGCHQLIASQRAHVTQHPDDVLRELGIIAATPGKQKPASFGSSEEEKVYDVLTGMPKPVDNLAEETALSIGTIAAALTMLELAGHAKNVGSGHWVKA